MNTLPVALALLMTVGLVMMTGAVWIYSTDRRDRIAQQRLMATLLPYAPAAVAAPGRRGRSSGLAGSAFVEDLLSRLAISPDRPDLYPCPWWLLVMITTVMSVIAVGISVYMIGPLAWLALPVAWFFLTRFTFGAFERRRTAVLYEQLPDALAMIGRSIRSGLTVQDALQVVADEGLFPTSMEFQRLHNEIRLGASLGEALLRLAQRSKLIEYRFFAVALALQSQSGGSLSETLENLADVVRKRVALRLRAMALSAEARLSMYVLGALPFVTGGAIMVTTPNYLNALFQTSLGNEILFAGLVLLALGFGSMKLIIKQSLS